MKHKKILGFIVAAVGFVSIASAASTPLPGRNDVRVRYVKYAPGEVTKVITKRGVISRVVFESDEKITAIATGFAADCAKDDFEWCIAASTGDNQIWIKPKDGATQNNIEVRTNKRDYSITLSVLEDSSPDDQAMYRVVYQYPFSAAPAGSAGASDQTTASVAEMKAELIRESLVAAPNPRNYAYSKEVLPGGEVIEPTLVFDDGRFTYFEFPANREVPSIYYISPAMEETRLNLFADGDLFYVHRTGRQFVLRLGAGTVGIWNEKFDDFGVPPQDGTTVPGIVRKVKAQQ